MSERSTSTAIAAVARAVQEDPWDLRSRLKLGDLLAGESRAAEACSEYEFVARAYERDRFFLKAVAVWKTVAKVGGPVRRARAAAALAHLYDELGLVSDSVTSRETAMRGFTAIRRKLESSVDRIVESEDVGAIRMLAECCLELGSFADALSWARRAYRDDPSSVETLRLLADALERTGEIEKSDEVRREILDRLPARRRSDATPIHVGVAGVSAKILPFRKRS